MRFTKAQFKKYLAGKLKIVTMKSTGVSKLVPCKPRGKVSAKRRAYYRMWYMKNSKKRRAQMKRYRKKRAAKKPASIEVRTTKLLKWATKNPGCFREPCLPNPSKGYVPVVRHAECGNPRSLIRRFADWWDGD